MTVEQLRPKPTQRVRFEWPYKGSVPEQSGCYVLATYRKDVLYVGLATTSIRSRMVVHLDTKEKRQGAPNGVPYWFYFIELAPENVHSVERGWMNQSILEDESVPVLNSVYSPCD